MTMVERSGDMRYGEVSTCESWSWESGGLRSEWSKFEQVFWRCKKIEGQFKTTNPNKLPVSKKKQR
jgi:hypothetical protein